MKQRRARPKRSKKSGPGEGSKSKQKHSSGTARKLTGKKSGKAKSHPAPSPKPKRSAKTKPSVSSLQKKLASLQAQNRKLFAKLKTKSLNQNQPKKRKIETQYERQVSREVELKQKKKALVAARLFKVRKGDRGKILFIGIHGQRNPQAKGRKGYAIIISKTGKKTLVKQRRTGYRAAKLSDVDIPQTKRNAKKLRDFQLARRETLKTGRVRAPKGTGKVTGMRRGSDFNETVIDKIASNVRDTIAKQRSARVFIITVIALIELPDGSTETVEIVVDIAKADQIAIDIGGIKNFVRRKLYGFLARELGYLGYVTSGSSNHIRRLAANKGKGKNKWTDGSGGAWAGRHKDEVKILALEWKIEQAK